MANGTQSALATIPAWLMAIALLFIAGAFGWITFLQPPRFEFAGLGFGVASEVDESLVGAVIAFDRADTDEHGACPEGWDLFQPAVGRMLLGADRVIKSGAPDNTRLLRPSYSEQMAGAVPASMPGAIDGEVEHTLTEAEMPSHAHDSGLFYAQFPDQNHGRHDVSVVGDQSSHPIYLNVKPTATTGGGGAHNNMPPYIALYFCKKES